MMIRPSILVTFLLKSGVSYPSRGKAARSDQNK